MMMTDFCYVFFSLVGLSLSILCYELHLKINSEKIDPLLKERLDSVHSTARLYSMICSVILIFSIYSRYDIGLKREISMDVYT